MKFICNDNLIMTVTKVIVGNKILTKNHLILSKYFFGPLTTKIDHFVKLSKYGTDTSIAFLSSR